MGVQPRPFEMPENDTYKSPSVQATTSPVTRKRRFMDVVLVGDASDDADAAEERELSQRVSFKHAKSGESELRVHMHEPEPSRDAESLEPFTPTASSLDATQDKGSATQDKGSPTAKAAVRPNMSASQTITLEMLRPHFEKPLAQVAQVFGICVTLLKKICRKNGLGRWPHRQIIGLRKSIASMEQAIGHFEGARRESYAHQLEKQRNKLAALLEDPTKCNMLAADDEYPPSQQGVAQPPVPVRSTTEPPALPCHVPYYTAYAPAPSAPVYQRAPAAYGEYYHTPQPVPHPVAYAPPAYYPPTYAPAYVLPTHQPPPPPAASVMLPPLRTDARQVLPSLSALVGRRW